MISPIFGELWDEPWLNILQMAVASGSFILNIILLLANYRRENTRWATDGILCTITGLADCTIAMYVMLSTAARTFDHTLLYDDSTWCRINYIVGRTMGLACLDVAALLSLVRYLVIVRGHAPHPRGWACVALSLLALIATVTFEHSRNSTIYVFPAKLYCSPVNERNSLLLLSILIQLLGILPLFVIPFCYARVSLHYVKIASRLSVQPQLRSKIFGICIMATAYILAFAPDYIIFGLLNYFYILPTPLLTGLASCISGCVSLLNAIFPLLYHTEIHQNALDLFSHKDSRHTTFIQY
ncbi:hypothetical protein DSO57_1038056 [Entomophthora muscae]|uniref:Uncharacterized protein n=1 Tax=Entomophthora muscae TaxID=34485 RepID=A0ACC2TXK0_9FUNG|nr:hypothetical protein DSO57_1038056 [Entomophthora muscae]